MHRLQLILVSLLMFTATTLRAAKLVLVAGGGEGGDGPALQAKLNDPFAVTSDPAGNLYFVELEGARLCKITPDGTLTTLAGTGKKGYSGDGGPAEIAQLNGPHHLLMAPTGDIYIADTFNSVIRRYDGKTGVITTFAGTGKKGFSGDGGPATKAEFAGVFCLSVDAAWKTMYIADLENHRIRAIDMTTHTVSTVAGNGGKGTPADGAIAAASPLTDPRAVAADGAGNIYVLERNGGLLRVVDSAGKIRTVAGTGKNGNGGDGGDARQAAMNGPKHLWVDLDGTVLIADAENHLVRRYNPNDGTMIRVAGTSKKGLGKLPAPPLEVELNRPHGVYVTPEGILYITDSYNHRIVRLEK